jgi:hypothetical protein
LAVSAVLALAACEASPLATLKLQADPGTLTVIASEDRAIMAFMSSSGWRVLDDTRREGIGDAAVLLDASTTMIEVYSSSIADPDGLHIRPATAPAHAACGHCTSLNGTSNPGSVCGLRGSETTYELNANAWDVVPGAEGMKQWSCSFRIERDGACATESVKAPDGCDPVTGATSAGH